MSGQLGVCQVFKDEIDRMEGDIKLLRQQLLRANPSEKRAIIAKIHNIELDEQLTSEELRQCLDRNPILDSIFCDPFNAIIPLGAVQQFTAVGNFIGGSQQNLTNEVIWTSDAMTVATINKNNGRATGLRQGTTKITATSGSIVGTGTLTVGLVSIVVNPSNADITFVGSPIGGEATSQQFKAQGTFADLTFQDVTASVVWTSSNKNVTTISNDANSKGRATGVSHGTAIIAANTTDAGSVVRGEATLKVDS
jgi:hypothetical protein